MQGSESHGHESQLGELDTHVEAEQAPEKCVGPRYLAESRGEAQAVQQAERGNYDIAVAQRLRQQRQGGDPGDTGENGQFHSQRWYLHDAQGRQGQRQAVRPCEDRDGQNQLSRSLNCQHLCHEKQQVVQAAGQNM